MNKRVTSGIVAAVVAISMSVPAVGLATKGGHPANRSSKCTMHHTGKHKGAAKGKKKGAGKGNKCGK
jgi:hypothetical protein